MVYSILAIVVPFLISPIVYKVSQGSDEPVPYVYWSKLPTVLVHMLPVMLSIISYWWVGTRHSYCLLIPVVCYNLGSDLSVIARIWRSERRREP